MSGDSAILIRTASRDDAPFISAVAARLALFDLPEWRSANEIVSAEVATLMSHFDAPARGSLLLVASRGHVDAGFIFLERQRDYFTGIEHGHVGILAVSAEHEGSGVGGALLRRAETWARDEGFATLTLNVFHDNRRARGLYEMRGFHPETVRYLKPLR